MRNASEWANMYAQYVGVLSPEELEAFVAAVQLDTLKDVKGVPVTEIKRLEKITGEYPEELFA